MVWTTTRREERYKRPGPSWMEENMIDLSNVTFIIPSEIDTDDRLRNIILSISFLLNIFDCKVIVKESDEMKKFEMWKLAHYQIHSDTSNLTYQYEENHDDHFHRTRLLNEMVIDATTEIVVNYDSDIILPISSYVTTKGICFDHESDVVYPYRFGGTRREKLS